eukprot:gnl/TRDRNA2_/TRDRNA2_85214_c0_seq2.p1 gnl/TRDRNA2_/TRDRNA2_85214_c0~~gnl/TRDRNA2_/TRDRNA2_85214_c0_seq2.p1  ORF type:complete len:396 (+),score=89.55 gnl/TRDRNA2_/TRDRNA2_85214_c0_seq2:139-1188(+)
MGRLQGIVRFSGATQFASGEWVGIELFEPWGKNDGSVQDVRYFTCKPKHGLFVRPNACELVKTDDEKAFVKVPSERSARSFLAPAAAPVTDAAQPSGRMSGLVNALSPAAAASPYPAAANETDAAAPAVPKIIVTPPAQAEAEAAPAVAVPRIVVTPPAQAALAVPASDVTPGAQTAAEPGTLWKRKRRQTMGHMEMPICISNSSVLSEATKVCAVEVERLAAVVTRFSAVVEDVSLRQAACAAHEAPEEIEEEEPSPYDDSVMQALKKEPHDDSVMEDDFAMSIDFEEELLDMLSRKLESTFVNHLQSTLKTRIEDSFSVPAARLREVSSELRRQSALAADLQLKPAS